MTKNRDVVITGMGLISPIGLSVTELISNLATGKTGIHLWESPRLSKKFPAALVQHSFTKSFTKLELPYLDRCSQMAILAARQAVADAGLAGFAEYGQRAGLYFGSARAGTETEEAWFEQFLIEHKETARPYSVFAIMHNAAAAHISIRHQILGPVMTHSSACTSSGCAIGDAYRAIRDGYLDVAIAGGAEAPITASVLGAWDGTRALAVVDPTDVGRSCRPFSKRRNGLVMGEGAGFIVLESAEHARSRGVECYGAVSGYGIASDGYHIGSPKVEGQVAAISAALDDANVSQGQINYFNAHATGTRGGDMVETNAIRLAFGDAATALPVSSTKSVHGHLLGAASVLEFIITTVAMTESFLPATTNLDEPDPDCNLNHIANNPIFDKPVEHAMSFSSGLGGTNVALVVSKYREMPSKRHVVQV